MTTAQRRGGITYDRHENGILIYRFHDNRRATIDAWIEQAYQDELVIQADGGIACILLDLRGHWITPYAVGRMMQSANLTPPGLQEWVAAVAGDSFAVRVLESVVHKFPAAVQTSARIFSTEEAALNWLEQKLQEFKAGKHA